MKKITKIPKKPEVGDIRVVSYYALFPITIQKETELETRYLERVYVKQQFKCKFNQSQWEHYWEDVDFTAKTEYITNGDMV